MRMDDKTLNYYGPTEKFVLTTKYPYELTAIFSNVTVCAIFTDWRIAAKFEDIVTEYSRLKQIDISIPNIDNLIFIMLKDEKGDTFILADYYIEDMYKL